MLKRLPRGRGSFLLGSIGAIAALFCSTGLSAQQDAAVPRVKPEAPASQFASRNDVERLRVIRDEISRKQFSRALAAINNLESPTAANLARWYYFYADDPNVDIAAGRAFLDANPEWPMATRIQTHLEKRMPSGMPTADVAEFFRARDPVSTQGKVHLARAQLARGETEAAELTLRDAWIGGTFTLQEEQRFLANYGGRLTAIDHNNRVDRLLWEREVGTARRVLSKLPPEMRRRAEARIALLSGGAEASRLYASLNDQDRTDPGVMLAAVRYYRRSENEPLAIQIARQADTTPEILRNPDRWWEERRLLMRWALKNRLYADAYAMAALHGLEPKAEGFAEAQFAAGWIALRFLDDAARAETHFAALTASVGTPISLARGQYWMARAAEARGLEEVAKRRYEAASAHIYTFYGQLAAERIGGDAAARGFEINSGPTPDDRARFGSRPAADALRLLAEAGDSQGFLIFAYHLDDRLSSPGEYLLLAELASRMSAPHITVRAGKVAIRNNAFTAEVAYPTIAIPSRAERFVPAEVILGISRQESEFNPRAFSSAGARGVMQLIPSTAQITARKEGLAYRQADLLNDPDYNMTLGAAHLSHLFERFGGSWIMSFAAYNAGAARVDQWVAAYGDPRAPGVDPLDWLELIPFEETRNYVQRVLENTQVYRSRLASGPIAGRLAADIERGGPAARIASAPALRADGPVPPLQARIVALADPILNPPPPPAPPPIVDAALDAAGASPVPVANEPAVRPARANHVRNRRDPSQRSNAQSSSPPIAGVEASLAEDPVGGEMNLPDVALGAAVVVETGSSDVGDQPNQEPAEPWSDIVDDLAAQSTAAPSPAPHLGFETGNPDAESSRLESLAADAGPANATDSECRTYVEYVAETDREEAAAADLNAGSLANFHGEGGACL